MSCTVCGHAFVMSVLVVRAQLPSIGRCFEINPKRQSDLVCSCFVICAHQRRSIPSWLEESCSCQTDKGTCAQLQHGFVFHGRRNMCWSTPKAASPELLNPMFMLHTQNTTRKRWQHSTTSYVVISQFSMLLIWRILKPHNVQDAHDRVQFSTVVQLSTMTSKTTAPTS